eukprot:4158963-Amphidinium_carterae.1
MEFGTSYGLTKPLVTLVCPQCGKTSLQSITVCCRHDKLRADDPIPSYTLTMELQLSDTHKLLAHPWCLFQTSYPEVHETEEARHISIETGRSSNGGWDEIVSPWMPSTPRTWQAFAQRRTSLREKAW